MRYGWMLGCVAVICLIGAPAQAQVHVDIGIHFPAPPPLVVIPEAPQVQYVPPAPAVSANLFFYNSQYWVFANGGWYVSTGYDGPWIVVAPVYVPAPLLRVPVRYYHEPPGHWRESPPERGPRWEREYGREWDEHRKGWRGRRAHDHEED